jgi:hypothetical protein
MKMARSQAVTTTPEKGIAVSDTRPSYLDPENRRGSEDVGIDDITLPRIEVLQALSPQIKRNDPKYIEGAEQGMIFNTVSGEIYGTDITFIPIVFRKEWIIWQTRKAGGGFVGSYPSEEEANAAYDLLENPDDHEVNLHAINFVYLCRDDGALEEAVFSWSRSKLKVSRKLNSLVQMNPGDRFSKAYRLRSIEEKGKKGEYFSYDIKPLGYVEENVYRKAEKLFTAIKAGERAVAYGELDPDAAEAEPESAVM